MGIFRFGLERYLRTLFPTSRTFLVGKREEGVHGYTNTWYTWKTFGTLCVLRIHLGNTSGDRNGTIYTFFPTSCTFLVGKREEEVHGYTKHLAYLENTWNTWYTWKTLGTLGILGTLCVLRIHLGNTSGDFSVWIGTVSSYSFSNISYISCWKRGGREHLVYLENTWYTLCTSKTLGILCVLRKHLAYLVYLENTWNTWYTWKTREKSLQTRKFLDWRREGLHSYTNTSKGEEGASFWIGTAPLYISNVPSLERWASATNMYSAKRGKWASSDGAVPFHSRNNGNLGVPNQFLFSIPACGNTNGSKRRKCKIENKTNLERKHYAWAILHTMYCSRTRTTAT